MFKIKPAAIIFDLDDTLIADIGSSDTAILKVAEKVREQYDVEPELFRKTLRANARELWYASPARDYCVRVGISSWEGMWLRIYSDSPDVGVLREWLPHYQEEAWNQTLNAFGIDDTALSKKLSDAYHEARRAQQIVFLEVISVLTKLKEHFRLGMLTNGFVDLQSEKIELSNLGRFFESITISGETGIGKPDKSIFQLALSRLGIRASEAIMVGDSLKSDIAGANAVGIRSIWKH